MGGAQLKVLSVFSIIGKIMAKVVLAALLLLAVSIILHMFFSHCDVHDWVIVIGSFGTRGKLVAAACCLAIFVTLGVVFCKQSRPSRKIITNNHEDQMGYLITHGRSIKETINLLRQVKRAGDVPPLYPNSWYEVMRSEDLPIGAVKAVSLIEKHLVVFRSEKGEVCIMDGYCPHLGANLGVGGTVKGSCIKCPFHGWEFDGVTGQCVNIPYSDKVPGFAKTNVWHSIERNGFICVWFDAEGREPPYLPEEVPQISSGKWTYRGCCVHYVNAHIQVRMN